MLFALKEPKKAWFSEISSTQIPYFYGETLWPQKSTREASINFFGQLKRSEKETSLQFTLYKSTKMGKNTQSKPFLNKELIVKRMEDNLLSIKFSLWGNLITKI